MKLYINNKYIAAFVCLLMLCLLSQHTVAQTCAHDFTVAATTSPSTCMANGTVTVTLDGDTQNLINIQYGLSSTDGFNVTPQNNSTISGVPAGTYTLTVLAQCSADPTYNEIKTIENVIVEGNYREIETSINFLESRKPYAGCATGSIVLNVTGGNGSLTFNITSAPAGVATGVITPIKDGDLYRFPTKNYSAGHYTVEISDECYTAIASFTLEELTGIPNMEANSILSSTINSPFYVDGKSCNIIVINTAGVSASADNDYHLYFEDEMYEIGAAPTGQTPTAWTDWVYQNKELVNGRYFYYTSTTPLDLSPYSYTDFFTSNSLDIHVRLKGYASYSRVYQTQTVSPDKYMTNVMRPIPYKLAVKDCKPTITICPDIQPKFLYCYPLSITIKQGKQEIYNNAEYQFGDYLKSTVPIEFDTSYTMTITDNTGKIHTINIKYSYPYTTEAKLSSTFKLYCEGWKASVELPKGCEKSMDIELRQGTTIIDTKLVTTEYYSMPLLSYGVDYSLNYRFVNGEWKTLNIPAKKMPTPSYTFTTSYSSLSCGDDMASFRLSGTNVSVGTTVSITGPSGYTPRTYTLNPESASKQEITLLPSAVHYTPAGTYTIVADNNCGNVQTIKITANGANYKVRNFGYTLKETCDGIEVTPTADIIYNGLAVPVYFHFSSGPDGYDQTTIPLGQTLTMASVGKYRLGVGIAQNPGATNYLVCSMPIEEYIKKPLSLDVSKTSAYNCIGGESGTIVVKAQNGIAPYTYELWNADNTQREAIDPVVSDDRAIFHYGKTGDKYTIHITDACGTCMDNIGIEVFDLSTINIASTEPSSVCLGESINLKCATLGGVSYLWTGPNGFTSTEQNPVITGATLAMQGTYKVSVTPEFCSQPIEGKVDITVYPSVAKGVSSGTQEICKKESVSLTSEVTGGSGSYTYQWQSSADGISGWTDISGATGVNYIFPAQTVSGAYYYRRITTDRCGMVEGDAILVNVGNCVHSATAPVNPKQRSVVETGE
ncbi:hypothetical protein M2451_002422 [Dysgonomonas sp. PFB1-18]|uniref:hypothetical protein n=1 Tax=unclassified Dysgonomonas TaxID=2630389 RepID=UPI002476B07F|nr:MULTISPECIES: hypothetical protein [unclassified Dysgonomonas]MDH6307188.1 hypothetical protein [Dysgonomonas sp. PF1-14]MDH6337107.1 hypothetical protein [Dysgonomonas sp. PF1-16]MDH6381093.1 hypothetical protein [Dysgonomonas sp. PFB1-18]MDH6396328.1 hypothetical protein [Dysgonomonas sp. PF1-23]